MSTMTDEEFLDYCGAHADTDRCGFTKDQIARLLRLAQNRDSAVARAWDAAPDKVYEMDRYSIFSLVALARKVLWEKRS